MKKRSLIPQTKVKNPEPKEKMIIGLFGLLGQIVLLLRKLEKKLENLSLM